jgi:glycosyltransferase involved in cell wall biosynthesis
MVDPSSTALQCADESILDAARGAVPSTLWIGAVSDTGGHADELRGFLRALERYGYEPALREVVWTDKDAGVAQEERAQLERQKERTPGMPLVAVHEYLPAVDQGRFDRAVNVSRVMFETDRMPQQWLTPLLDRDELWVPSAFNAETFASSGIPEERIKLLGGTLDFDAYAPGLERWDLGAPDRAFTFLTNFDFSERKGWKQLLLAWAKAFGPDDDVCLVLKVGSFYIEDQTVEDKMRAFLRSALGSAADRLAPIRFLTDRLPAAAMPRLYAGADAYVLPSRGEGWGRPFMEALAMGLPTIASNWSAHLEFMDPATSWLIDGEVVPVADDAELFSGLYKGHRWFEADVDALADAMREVASDPAAARAKASPARADLIRRFGPDAIAARIGELATGALERHAERRARPPYVSIRGRFGSVDSMAVVNDALATGLLDRGLNVYLRDPVADPEKIEAPTVSQSWPPVFEPATHGPTVTVLHWEFGAAPKEWVDQVRRQVDRVWVASEYVRQGYIASGMPPGVVDVVPCGVDLDRFTPAGPRYELPRQAGCTFLFVGGTTWRKGADVLLEGWRRAFGPGDDVQLVIKDFGVNGVYRNQGAGDHIKQLIASGTTAPITYMHEELPHGDLPALYRAADAVVLPYRGEGFCLPALEAMACGIPVIHNGNGPTAEFVGDVGGWALPSERIPLPEGAALPQLAVPGWVHEVDPDVLAEQLRAVAAAATDRRDRGRRAVEQARGYSLDAFIDRAAESLAALTAEGLPLARAIRRTEVESRAHTVVYAPDWGDEDAWARALRAWAAVVPHDAPATLVLHVPDADAEALAGRIVARLEADGHAADALPDLALCPYSEATAVALAASADGVLADAGSDLAARPDLFRRARRLIEAAPGAIAAFVESGYGDPGAGR